MQIDEATMRAARDRAIETGTNGADALLNILVESGRATYAKPSNGPLEVILNGRKIQPEHQNYLYEGIVELAGLPANSRPTITYTEADGIGGELLPGDGLALVPGMVINCFNTGGA